MAREGLSGWFVEVPTELKIEFERLYPGRSKKRKLTIAFIRWAIEQHPRLKEGTIPLPESRQHD